MMAKPTKTVELHNPMIQFLIVAIIWPAKESKLSKPFSSILKFYFDICFM